MTHEYTLLVGGTVIPGAGAPDATAIAWAAGVILVVGTDDAVRAISRGDSLTVPLDGAVVVATAEPLEVGAPADIAIHARDPRGVHAPADPLATVRGGHLVAGSFPGLGSGAATGSGTG